MTNPRLVYPFDQPVPGVASQPEGNISKGLKNVRTENGSGQGQILALTGFCFFFTLVTGPRRSLNLKLSDTRVCEPYLFQVAADLVLQLGLLGEHNRDELRQ